MHALDWTRFYEGHGTLLYGLYLLALVGEFNWFGLTCMIGRAISAPTMSSNRILFKSSGV